MGKLTFEELSAPLTAEEKREIEAAAAREPDCGEDCPEMTPEKLAQFRRAAPPARGRQTVSLRLSPETLALAKGYGKGYTAFLSRLIDAAIRDEELVKKCI